MLTTIEKVLLLQELEMFRFAPTEDLAQFAGICEEVQIGAGEEIFEKETENEKLLLLVRGRVQLDVEEGEPAETHLEHAPLNLWTFFSDAERSFQATALDSCLILSASKFEVKDLLMAEPEFCFAILTFLARSGFYQFSLRP